MKLRTRIVPPAQVRFSLCLTVLLLLSYGINKSDIVAKAGAIFLLILAALCAISTWVGKGIVRARFRQAEHSRKIHLLTHRSSATGFRIKLPRWLDFLNLSWTLNGVPIQLEKHGRVLTETANVPRRQLVKGLTRVVSVSDGFGFFEFRFTQLLIGKLRVLPSINSSKANLPLLSVVDGSDLPDPYSAPTGDRIDMRRYRPGDPLRLVLWNIYQRTGMLMVRTPERALSRHQRTGMFLLTGPNDQPAACLARAILETQGLGPRWRFGSEGSCNWAEDLPSALDELAKSGNEPNVASSNSPRFLEDLSTDGFGQCLVVLSPDPASRNQRLLQLFGAQQSSRVKLIVWVVFEGEDVPLRNTFPSVPGCQVSFIGKRDEAFEVRFQ